MAIGSTVCKAGVNISDMDRHYYEDHELTLARHPSETDERMMIRLAAFAFDADARLVFTRGLCAEDEPELWLKDYEGAVSLWIDLGQVDEKRLRKACGRSERVIVYVYQEKPAREWWQRNAGRFRRFSNLEVYFLHAAGISELSSRTMRLQATIADGELNLHDESGGSSVTVTREQWQ